MPIAESKISHLDCLAARQLFLSLNKCFLHATVFFLLSLLPGRNVFKDFEFSYRLLVTENTFSFIFRIFCIDMLCYLVLLAIEHP